VPTLIFDAIADAVALIYNYVFLFIHKLTKIISTFTIRHRVIYYFTPKPWIRQGSFENNSLNYILEISDLEIFQTKFCKSRFSGFFKYLIFIYVFEWHKRNVVLCGGRDATFIFVFFTE
jgi:hypothetical protein